MKAVILGATAFCLTLAVVEAKAKMSSDQMSTAYGLALVIGNADRCGYSVDQDALDHYFVQAGLSTPDGLGYINSIIPGVALKPLSQSECTIAKATAKSLGILPSQ